MRGQWKNSSADLKVTLILKQHGGSVISLSVEPRTFYFLHKAAFQTAMSCLTKCVYKCYIYYV